MSSDVSHADALQLSFVPVAGRSFAEVGRVGRVASMAQRALERFVSVYEADGRLGTFRMSLLVEAEWRTLLEGFGEGRLLDVGSGNGDVLTPLAARFTDVLALETAPAMVRRLGARGFVAREHDLSLAPIDQRFDVVSLLNVLDRTARPVSLLDHALRAVSPGGALVVATPFPMRPCAYDGARTSDPDEWLPHEGTDFESALRHFVREVVAPRSLELVRWTRVPYVSSGDDQSPYYTHDDAVMVLAAR